jgi:hypothetical protein
MSTLQSAELYQLRAASKGDAAMCGAALAHALSASAVSRGSKLTQGLSIRSVAIASAVRRFRALKDSVRRSALESILKLGAWDNPAVLDELLVCTSVVDGSICCDALRALPSCPSGDRRIVAAIVDRFVDDRPDVRRASESAMSKLVLKAPYTVPEEMIRLFATKLRNYTCCWREIADAARMLAKIADAGGDNAMNAIVEHLGPGYVAAVRRAMSENVRFRRLPESSCFNDSGLGTA